MKSAKRNFKLPEKIELIVPSNLEQTGLQVIFYSDCLCRPTKYCVPNIMKIKTSHNLLQREIKVLELNFQFVKCELMKSQRILNNTSVLYVKGKGFIQKFPVEIFKKDANIYVKINQ